MTLNRWAAFHRNVVWRVVWRGGVGCGLALGASLFAADPTPGQKIDLSTIDKSKYSLLHPTPARYLREMSTDRPDKTESPFTVDAGHFQIEADLLSYTRDRDTAGGADTRLDGYAFAPMNLKAGLCNRVDLQVLLGTFNYVRTDDRVAGTVTRQRGFGDVTTRLKVNFWGNDGGPTAFGVMPFLKIPTSQDNLGNRAFEGGVILPFAMELPFGFGLGAMAEYDYRQNSFDNRYHSEFINTLTFGHKIAGNLDGYVELFSSVSTERGSSWIGTADVGLTYGLTENIQLDAGINFGVTKSAPDLNPFLGVSFRF